MNGIANLTDEILTGKGYIILPDLLTPDQAQEARSRVLELADEERPQGKLLISGKKERLYGLIYKGEIFEYMVQHPKIMATIEAILGSDMTLGGFSAHILHPGAVNMGVHVDYPYWAMQPPFPESPPLEIQVIWMVEDFTEENGAPLFAANTQKRCCFPESEEFKENAIKITGKAGSAVISHGLCWHDTSVNSTSNPRVSILGNYNPKIVRPLEDHSRDRKQEVIDRASPKLKQLLGYEFKSALMNDIKNLKSKYLT